MVIVPTMETADLPRSKRARLKNPRYFEESIVVAPAAPVAVEPVDSSGLERADMICQNHITARTRKNYQYKIDKIKAYCVEKKPSYIENNELKLPLDEIFVKAFLGDISKERPDKTVPSEGTIGGYISALKWLYVRITANEFGTGFNLQTIQRRLRQYYCT